MKISLGSDHAGFKLKEKVKALLGQLGHEVKDVGTFAAEPPVDYPLLFDRLRKRLRAANANVELFSVAPATAKRWWRTKCTGYVARCAGIWKARGFLANITMPMCCLWVSD